jgi:hypothetical protein
MMLPDTTTQLFKQLGRSRNMAVGSDFFHTYLSLYKNTVKCLSRVHPALREIKQLCIPYTGHAYRTLSVRLSTS